MLRILEIAWLIFAVTGAGLAVFKLFTEGVSESLFILPFTLVAAVFYFIRRKQRIAMERESRTVKDASLKS
jgi:hypothetical protein